MTDIRERIGNAANRKEVRKIKAVEVMAVARRVRKHYRAGHGVFTIQNVSRGKRDEIVVKFDPPFESQNGRGEPTGIHNTLKFHNLPMFRVLDGKQVFDPAGVLQDAIAETLEKYVRRPMLGTRVVGSTISTFYAETGDGTIQSTDPVYANASAGSNLVAATAGVAGTIEHTNAAIITIRNAFFRFDTSSIPDGDTISDVAFSLYKTGAGVFADDNGLSLYSYDYGAALTVADWQAPGDLSGVIATALAAGGAGYLDFTLSVAPTTAGVAKDGYSGYLVCFGFFASLIVPTGLNSQAFSMADEAGTTQDPKLVVTHADITDPVWNSTVGARAATAGDRQITVSWNGATDATNPPTKYNVYHDTVTPVGIGTTATALLDVTTAAGTGYDYEYDITGLSNGTTYYIVVRAEDQVGNEDSNTNEVSAMPFALPVPPGYSRTVDSRRRRRM